MEKRNVVGLDELKFALVLKHSNRVVSLHEHPDNALRAMNASVISDALEIVELLDPIGYRRY